ncbi:alpha-L-rhamnosidase N-terminal domain-containing protein [Paenibacillus frigoriresistens]|uniref:alpha-L-rhamnosidase N-terminal domain-containing protein n=1 Tax=Paenibacillus alginolyticus TaxID=59839 RepID=UPI00156745F4|nr:alpha-L-rhamnosidase N-terminal domain-containing protein [Paenibacillus frigoriresistens]NRF93391.1 alpha-L-rhamnosidase N-terminal domain-containing protein [Paenibacillus frigoriresistens]
MSKHWQARWITDNSFSSMEPLDLFHKEMDAAESETHREDLQHHHWLVRTTFDLASINLESVPLYMIITADDYYKLYLNGRFVAQGPAQNDAGHYYYNRIEVGSFLQEGNNVISVHVYYQGLVNRAYNSGDYRQGLIAELTTGDRVLVKTDETWRAKRAEGFQKGDTFGYLTQFTEHIDARKSESFTFEFVNAAGNHGTATATVNNIAAKSKAKPGTVILSDDNGYDTGLLDGTYNVTMNMWYGENGRIYKLYENDVLIDTKILTDNSPNAQTVTTAVYGKKNGIYRYYAELTNSFGTTTSATHVVTVTKAAPEKSILSNDNWDGDGNFKVSMNMWWGTNGGTYNLYENGILIYTEALANHTPNAQSSVMTVANRAKGYYEYRAELTNYAGTTSSEKMIVNVTK